MNFIKQIFSKPSTSQIQQKPKNQTSEFSILDPQFTQVRLRDAKLLMADSKKLEQVLNYQPQSINEQLKKCYALHIILSSDQYQVIDKVVQYCEQNHVKCNHIRFSKKDSIK